MAAPALGEQTVCASVTTSDCNSVNTLKGVGASVQAAEETVLQEPDKD